MTAAAEAPPQPLFHSPLGLFEFQADHTARSYYAWSTEEPVRLALWDTGLGKTVLSLASLSLAFEDDLIDVAIVVAEANKVMDWAKVDIPKFTDLTVRRYSGDGRMRMVEKQKPQVLVMSYATGRNDICGFKPRSNHIDHTKPQVLVDYLRGKRVAFIFDEFSVLRTRSAKTYVAWEYLLRTLRKERKPMMLGLTATTVESKPEDHFNACRLLSPERSPNVDVFYQNYVAAYDLYDNPIEWKNLTRERMVDPGVLPLNEIYAPITLRKKKTDPDVIEQFPRKMENPPTMVDLDPSHKRLYDSLEEIFGAEDIDERTAQQGFGLMRLLLAHPSALFTSEGQYAKEVIEQVGASYIEGLKSAKVEAMLAWQERMAQQQTVIFTFYGQSVLPILHHHLVGEGYKVSVNHGKMSQAQRQASQDAYKAGGTQIFLSSDAGAKGLNLGCGSGLLHYELPVLWSTYEQRSNRIHRIDSVHPSVTIDALVSKDTLEFPMGMKMLKRNVWAEQVQDVDIHEEADPGEGYLRASDRIALLRRAAK